MDREAVLKGVVSLLALAAGDSVEDFCARYERVWNFEFDKTSIPHETFKVLDALFDEVVFLNSIPRELWEYPKYRDEPEIRKAVDSARQTILGADEPHSA